MHLGAVWLWAASTITGGCHRAPITTVAPAEIVGTYALDRSGKTLGQLWSVKSTLTLMAPDRYTMDLVVRTSDETNDESQSGWFRIQRDVLELRSDKNESSKFLVRGDSLVSRADWPGRLFVRFAGGPLVYVRSYEAPNPR